MWGYDFSLNALLQSAFYLHWLAGRLGIIFYYKKIENVVEAIRNSYKQTAVYVYIKTKYTVMCNYLPAK